MPSFISISILRSTIFFSNLNSGIPNLRSPPGSSFLSNTETLCPALFNCWAAAKPAGPDPTIAIFLLVLFFGISGNTNPDSHAFSMIFFSIISIATGS